MAVGALDLGQALIVAFTGVVAVSTVIYAFLTWRLVSETRRMRRAQTEPRVSVHVELNETSGDGSRMDLMIQNVGQGPAEEIRFEFEGDPTYFGKGRPIDQLSVFKNGLPYLSPNQSFRIVLGWLYDEEFTRATQKPWDIRVRYKNVAGEEIPESTFSVDFSQFKGLIASGSPLYRIEKHLDSLRKDIHKLTEGSRELQVITQSIEEYREDQKERFRKIGEMLQRTDSDD